MFLPLTKHVLQNVLVLKQSRIIVKSTFLQQLGPNVLSFKLVHLKIVTQMIAIINTQ